MIDVEDIRPVAVSFTETSLVIELADGRSIATPTLSLWERVFPPLSPGLTPFTAPMDAGLSARL